MTTIRIKGESGSKECVRRRINSLRGVVKRRGDGVVWCEHSRERQREYIIKLVFLPS